MPTTVIQYTIKIRHAIDWSDPETAKLSPPFFDKTSTDVKQYVRDMISEDCFEVDDIDIIEHDPS